MTIAVRYKRNRPGSEPVTILVELPADFRADEDAFWDYAHEYISENILGEEPKWISLKGIAQIDDFNWKELKKQQ